VSTRTSRRPKSAVPPRRLVAVGCTVLSLGTCCDARCLPWVLCTVCYTLLAGVAVPLSAVNAPAESTPTDPKHTELQRYSDPPIRCHSQNIADVTGGVFAKRSDGTVTARMNNISREGPLTISVLTRTEPSVDADAISRPSADGAKDVTAPLQPSEACSYCAQLSSQSPQRSLAHSLRGFPKPRAASRG
jgi:hypothetical protein